MIRKRTTVFVLIMLFVAGLSFDATAKFIYVKKKPPVRKVVAVKSKSPYKNGIWVSGSWTWNGHQYVWIKGRWERPRKGLMWIEGHWKNTQNGWIWINGHWKKR